MIKIEDWEYSKLIAQCVFPRLDIDRYLEEIEYKNNIIELIKLGVGGFCVFKGNTESVNRVLNELQNYAEIPLLNCADFEFGLPMRLEDGTSFPHAMALGKTFDVELTKRIAEAIAEESVAIGINWVLAPVCDINNNPDNPVINIRAFADNPSQVSDHVNAFITGLNSKKVLSSAKHFPGHGNSSIDSHLKLPMISISKKEFEEFELIPFKNAIQSNVSSIMLGHLLYSELDKDLPASLSTKIVSYIRNELNYNGLLLTDALDMKGLEQFADSNLIATVLKAGIDIALMPDNPLETLNNAIEILKNNSELKQNIIESVKRIYNKKRWCGIVPFFVNQSKSQKAFIEHQNLALKAAYYSINILNDKNVPINSVNNFTAFGIIQKDEDLQSASRFFTLLAQSTEANCDYAYIDLNITDENIEDYLSNLEDTELVIFACFFKGRGMQTSFDKYERLKEIINKLRNDKPSITILMGNPYLDKAIESDNIIYSYSDSFASLAAVVMKLTDRHLPEEMNI